MELEPQFEALLDGLEISEGVKDELLKSIQGKTEAVRFEILQVLSSGTLDGDELVDEISNLVFAAEPRREASDSQFRPLLKRFSLPEETEVIVAARIQATQVETQAETLLLLSDVEDETDLSPILAKLFSLYGGIRDIRQIQRLEQLGSRILIKLLGMPYGEAAFHAESFLKGDWTAEQTEIFTDSMKDIDNPFINSAYIVKLLCGFKRYYLRDADKFRDWVQATQGIRNHQILDELKKNRRYITSPSRLRNALASHEGECSHIATFLDGAAMYDEDPDLEEISVELARQLPIREYRWALMFIRDKIQDKEIRRQFFQLFLNICRQGRSSDIFTIRNEYGLVAPQVKDNEKRERFFQLYDGTLTYGHSVLEAIAAKKGLYSMKPAWVTWIIKNSLEKGTPQFAEEWVRVHMSNVHTGLPPKMTNLYAKLALRYGTPATDLLRNILAQLKLRRDEEATTRVFDIIDRRAANGHEDFISQLSNIHGWIERIEEVEIFADQCARGRGALLEQLLSKNIGVPREVEVLDKVLDFLKEFGVEFCEKEVIDAYLADLEKGSEAVFHAMMLEVQDNWADWKRGVISPEISEHRGTFYYVPLLRAIFGKDTSYTSLEHNLTAKDAPEHLNRFKLPPGQMVEAQIQKQEGYLIQDGREENTAHYQDYRDRLQNIVELTKKFNSKKEKTPAFEAVYQGSVLATYLEDEKLSVQEKLLACLLSQNIRRDHFDLAIDYLIAYHYGFLEDWDEFAMQSHDTIESAPNAVSKRYQELVYMEGIFGEQLKHDLQFSFKVSNPVVAAYKRALADSRDGESAELPEKEQARIDAILTNPHISEDKKITAIEGNVVRYFTRGLNHTKAGVEELIESIKEASADFFAGKTVDQVQAELGSLITELEALNFDYENQWDRVVDRFIRLDVDKIRQLESAYAPNVINSEESAIQGVYMKTRESASARMTSNLCIGEDQTMYDNTDYFEMVFKDPATGVCLGLTMYLHIDLEDGKKYLWFGPNPSADALKVLGEREVFNFLKREAINFAKANDYDGIVVPTGELFGPCTNRGGLFLTLLKQSRLKSSEGFKEVDFGKEVHLSKEGYRYAYKEGILIWEKAA